MSDTRHPRDDFDDAYEVQRDQSNRFAAVDRTVENLDEIVAERIELDALRTKTRSAKAKIVSRYEPPVPDHVEQPLGTPDTSRFGKVGATLGVLGLVAGIAVLWFGIIEPLANPYPIEIDRVTNERIDVDAPCVWSFDVALTNGYDEPVRVERAEVVVNRRRVTGTLQSSPPIPAGESGTVTVSVRAGTVANCPTVDQIDHGTLSITTDPFGFVDTRF